MLLIDWNNKTLRRTFTQFLAHPAPRALRKLGLCVCVCVCVCVRERERERESWVLDAPSEKDSKAKIQCTREIFPAIRCTHQYASLSLSYLYLPFENSHDPMIVFVLPVWLYALYTDKTTPPVITSFRLHQIAKGAFPIASCPRSQHALLDIPTCFAWYLHDPPMIFYPHSQSSRYKERGTYDMDR